MNFQKIYAKSISGKRFIVKKSPFFHICAEEKNILITSGTSEACRFYYNMFAVDCNYNKYYPQILCFLYLKIYNLIKLILLSTVISFSISTQVGAQR